MEIQVGLFKYIVILLLGVLLKVDFIEVSFPFDLADKGISIVDDYNLNIKESITKKIFSMKDFKLNTISLKEACFEKDTSVLRIGCECFTCREGYTKAYIHHLFKCSELNGHILLCMHNLFYIEKLHSNFSMIEEKQRYDYFLGYLTSNLLIK